MDNPETLEIYVFPGADNSYVLYEDEGEGFGFEKGRLVKTYIEALLDGGPASIHPAAGGRPLCASAEASVYPAFQRI